jgi:hypothetical protein
MGFENAYRKGAWGMSLYKMPDWNKETDIYNVANKAAEEAGKQYLRAEKAEADLILLQSTHKTALLALEMLRQEVLNERLLKEKVELAYVELGKEFKDEYELAEYALLAVQNLEADRAELLEALKNARDDMQSLYDDWENQMSTEQIEIAENSIEDAERAIARMTGETK